MVTTTDEQIEIDDHIPFGDHVLFTYIDQWEKYSIAKIHVAAQQARTDLMELFNAKTVRLMNSINLLNAGIKQTSTSHEANLNQLQALCEYLTNFFSFIHLEHDQRESPIHLIKLNFDNNILEVDNDSDKTNGRSLYVPGTAPLLAAMFQNASPIQQKQLLGERLFVVVQQMEPKLAAKITGMFLEYENEHIFTLLKSPKTLGNKIREAIQVLQLYEYRQFYEIE